MLTIEPNTLLHRDLLLRPPLVSYQGLLWILSLVKIPWLIDTMMWKRQLGSFKKSRGSTRQYRNSWKRVRPSTRLGMISIGWSIVFKLETKFGCISARTGCKVKVRTTCSGQVEYLRNGLKGSKPSSVKWIEIGQVR